MGKLFKLSVLEFQKIFKRKGIYIGILIASFFSIAIGLQARVAPASFNSKHVFSFFAGIANIVLIVFASKSLGDEFDLKTSTQIFTSKRTRTTIILSKLFSIILLSILMALISAAILITFKGVLNEPLTVKIALKDLWVLLYSFILYAFVVSSFSLLMTMIYLNTTSTMVTSLAAFWIAPNIISTLIARAPSIEKIFRVVPFYTADGVLSYHKGGTIEIIGIIVFGILFYMTTAVITQTKDLR